MTGREYATAPNGLTVEVDSPDDDDPFAGIEQCVFDQGPSDDDDERRARQHIAQFALDAVDVSLSRSDRENALRHLLACDPARGAGLLTILATNGLHDIEILGGHPTGSLLRQLRETLTSAVKGEGPRPKTTTLVDTDTGDVIKVKHEPECTDGPCPHERLPEDD